METQTCNWSPASYYKYKKIKWKWAGRTVRGTKKWTKTVMNWYTGHLNRRRGRSFIRWVAEIMEVAERT